MAVGAEGRTLGVEPLLTPDLAAGKAGKVLFIDMVSVAAHQRFPRHRIGERFPFAKEPGTIRLMSEFRVARATVDKAPLAAAILREAALWLEATGKKNWEPEWFTPESMVPNAERGELWLAWEGSDPVGTMLLAETDEDFWPEDSPGVALYVHKLAVARRAAGRGVSQALLRQAEIETAAADVSHLKLDCRADRPKLQALYEGAGFHRVDERIVFGWLNVVRYEKRSV